jgi:hypothetical protein
MNSNNYNKLPLNQSSKSSALIFNGKFNTRNSHSTEKILGNQVKQPTESKSDNNYSFETETTSTQEAPKTNALKKNNSPNKRDRFRLKNLLSFPSFKFAEDNFDKEANAKKPLRNENQTTNSLKDSKNKLTHQALSLSSGVTTLSNTNNYSPKLVPFDCITENLRTCQFYFSLDKKASNDKLKVDNATESSNGRFLFPQPGLLFRRRDATDQKQILTHPVPDG